MAQEPDEAVLTDAELLVFGALARRLVGADGQLSAEEAAALEDVGSELLARTGAPVLGPYRSGPAAPTDAPDPERVADLLERAAEALPDEEAVLRAAREVTRQAARETVFGALYAIAASDVIAKAEWPILEWLEREWDVSIDEVPAEE
jgi:hypothetical protein